MIGSDLTQNIGHQSYLLGFVGQHQVNKFLFLTIALDIKLGGNNLLQIKNILVTNVALIRAWVHGDTLRSKTFTIFCNLYQVRIITSARITQRSYFIDVDR
jgi:hypothetical protein